MQLVSNKFSQWYRNENWITDLSSRLQDDTKSWSLVACRELGLPITFVCEQLDYAARCLLNLKPTAKDWGEAAVVAFLFPSNTEGAMAVYLTALAISLGLKVHVKLSHRTPGIQNCLESLFAFTDSVQFYYGSGQAFLQAVLLDPQIRFVQVFGDDAWISDYENAVRASGQILAFDGPGKDPVIVLPGADLNQAVRAAVVSGLFAGGAACMSAERFLVHDSLVQSFLDGLADQLTRIKPMAPDSPEAALGYLYSQRAADRMNEQIGEAVQRGASIVLHGTIQTIRFAGREFYACSPTVLHNIPGDARVVTEETFGPVFPVQSFDTIEAAATLAENCPYGLTATVIGPGAEALAQRLASSHAIVYSNETLLEGFQADHWGCGGYKRSGWIWETGPAGFRTRFGYRPLRTELEKMLLSHRQRWNDDPNYRLQRKRG